MKDALELMVARNLLARALSTANSMELSDRTSATISAWALLLIQIMLTSPQDQADQAAALAGMMRD